MPINTNDMFKEAFAGMEAHYVLIGGTATSIILAENMLESRTTKDYDLVLIEEKLCAEFYEVLCAFLEKGGYTPSVYEGKGYLYRFTTQDDRYPKMIELFSRLPRHKLLKIGRTTPVSFDCGLSLSALLLDDDYYSLLKDNIIVVDGYSVLNNKCLIVFKAKAWLDLSTKKESGESITSTNIKKHLNDIARLSGTLIGNESISVSSSVRSDMKQFIAKLSENVHLIPENDDIILSKHEVLDILNNLLL